VRLDRVAAIRFASVYRNFERLEEFEAELRRVGGESAPDQVPEPLLIGPVVDGADLPPVPSGSQGNIRRSPAAPATGRREPRTTTRRVHVE
ncbi:MAG: hypothetical protein LC777_19915, partial [Actinobacteria bacterium]|nr:hypothetical protein [Actinomycetota bacterium]